MKTHSAHSIVLKTPAASGTDVTPEPLDFSFHSEFAAAKFGHKRLNDRVVRIADRALRCPESSIPTFLGGASQAEGLYRFVANPKVTPALVIQPHQDNTVSRCAAVNCVIVASDSSTHGYGNDSKRKGLGQTVAGGLGFILHASIAIDEKSGKILGLLHHTTWVRPLPQVDNEPPAAAQAEAAPAGQRGETQHKPLKSKGKSKKSRKQQDDPSNEGARWLGHALKCGKILGNIDRVHVADREADDFKYFAGLRQANESFVSRVNADRVLADGSKLFVKMRGMVVQLYRLVVIDHHKTSVGAKAQKTHPARERRQPSCKSVQAQ